jgi:hypothetical protein
MATMEPIDETFFETASMQWSRSWDIPAPAADIWAELAADRPLHWCRALRIHWTSPRPFHVGTTREVKVLGLLHGKEHFFIWDEGRRYAFHFTSANLPLLKRFGEYYEVEPTGEQSCRFVWKLAADPSLPRPLAAGPLNLLMANLFHDTNRFLAKTYG